MNKSANTSTNKRAESVARKRGGMTVPASPLNVVKLDLAIILFIALVLGLLVEYTVHSLPLQFTLLAGFGFLAMGWLIWRTKRVLARHGSGQATTLTGSGNTRKQDEYGP